MKLSSYITFFPKKNFHIKTRLYMFLPILAIHRGKKVQKLQCLPGCIDYPCEDGQNSPQHVTDKFQIMLYCILYCTVYYVGFVTKNS